MDSLILGTLIFRIRYGNRIDHYESLEFYDVNCKDATITYQLNSDNSEIIIRVHKHFQWLLRTSSKMTLDYSLERTENE